MNCYPFVIRNYYLWPPLDRLSDGRRTVPSYVNQSICSPGLFALAVQGGRLPTTCTTR